MILALEVFAIPRIGGGFTGSLFASEYTFIVEDHQRTPIHRTVRGGIRTLCGGQGGLTVLTSGIVNFGGLLASLL